VLQLRWSDLRFAQLAPAFLLAVALLAIPLILLLARGRPSRHAPRKMALPPCFGDAPLGRPRCVIQPSCSSSLAFHSSCWRS
jgi:hypothetical protein